MFVLLRRRKFGLAIAIGLVMALAVSGAVYAEGETTAETPAAADEAATPEEDGEAITEAGTEAAGEDTTTTEEPNGEEAPAESEPPEENSIPEHETGTAEAACELAAAEVVLADGNGEALEMASAETAEAMAAGDPWWKVGTVTYSTEFTGNCDPAALGLTCWESTTPINEALSRIEGGLFPTDGKLYVLAGTYDDVININATGTVMEKFKGIIGVPSSLNGTYTTFLTGNVSVQGTLAGFTLSGFDIASSVSFDNNTGTLTLSDLYVHKDTGNGISVTNHNGTIKMENVRSEGNSSRGARLDNSASSSAGVSVTNSSFNNNTVNSTLQYGLYVKSNGAVTINGITASNINGNGLEVAGAKSVTIKNSVFNNNYADPNNAAYGYGVVMNLSGRITNVTLENVFANGNENTGVNAVTQGKITIKNLQALSNGGRGLYLDNCDLDGLVCLSPVKNALTITSADTDGNGSYGTQILSKGSVTLSSVRARTNTSSGVNIDNCMADGGSCQGSGSVKVSSPKAAGESGANDFSGNGGIGLDIKSFGTISLSNFKANENVSGSGVVLDNQPLGTNAGVTVSATIADFQNETILNGLYGIWFRTKGNVSLARILSTDNTRAGAYIDNDDVVKNVTVSEGQFSSNGWHGLWIASQGNVTVTNTSSFDNDPLGLGTNHGLYIQNPSDPSGTLTVKSTSASTIYDFSGNSGTGIYAFDWKGAITIKSARVDDNDESGVFLDNRNAATAKPVTLANINAGGNAQYGIWVRSAGSISAQNLHTSGNNSTNTYLDNCLDEGSGCQGSGNITIGGTANEFSGSTAIGGLVAYSKGNIMLMNFSADYNALTGVVLSNLFDNSTANITIKSSKSSLMNTASGNGLLSNTVGVNAESHGTITVQNVEALNNTAAGVNIYNPDDGLIRTVSVTRSKASGNSYSGLTIQSDGPVTLKDTSALGNGWWGAEIVTLGNVNVSCSGAGAGKCQFSENVENGGLSVNTSGTVTISKVMANENGNNTSDPGIEVYGSEKAITISKVTTVDNAGRGVYVSTKGNITLSSAYSSGNYYGAHLLNNDGTGNILVNGTNVFEDNDWHGLYVRTNGTATVSNVIAGGSTTYDGVNINAYGEGKAVTLTNVATRYNGRYGVAVTGDGNITLNKVDAVGNTNHGLFLSNVDGDIVTIKNSNFLYNGRSGINANVEDPTDLSKFKLSAVNYFGNNTSDGGYLNMYVY